MFVLVIKKACFETKALGFAINLVATWRRSLAGIPRWTAEVDLVIAVSGI